MVELCCRGYEFLAQQLRIAVSQLKYAIEHEIAKNDPGAMTQVP